MKTIVLVSVWLGLCQFGAAGTLTLQCESSFITTGGDFACPAGNSSASISNGFATVRANSTILDPPPNPTDDTEQSSVSWNSTLLLDFTSGPAGLPGGYFLPCLGTNGIYGVAGGSFGGVQTSAIVEGPSFLSATCSGSPADFSATNDIPFTFGVTQTFALSLGGLDFGGIFGGNIEASFSRFEVFDAAGDNITSEVTFTLEDADAPEPGTFMLLAGGLLICCVINRLKRA